MLGNHFENKQTKQLKKKKSKIFPDCFLPAAWSDSHKPPDLFFRNVCESKISCQSFYIYNCAWEADTWKETVKKSAYTKGLGKLSGEI